MADVDKEFDDLNIKVYDEGGRTLRVSSISIDRPRQKEVTISFNKPIEKGERARESTSSNTRWMSRSAISKTLY